MCELLRRLFTGRRGPRPNLKLCELCGHKISENYAKYFDKCWICRFNENIDSKGVKVKYRKDIYEQYDYICATCAEELGGEWPEGLLSTMHVTECDRCNKERSCCDVIKWNFPIEETT